MSAAARFRYTLAAGATAVVIGSGFTVVGLTKHADAEARVPSSADRPLVAAPGESGTAGGNVLPDPSTDPSTPVTPAPTPSASASASKATPKPSTSTKKTSRPKATKTSAKAPSIPVTNGPVVEQVLAHINAARTAAGLGSLTLDTQLSKASALHNGLMIDGCGLSHQCSGETGIGPRFSAQGVRWNSAGENIGFGSSGSSNAEMVKAANGLTDSMLAEVPPNDGHRKNLLNKGFGRIGLSVVRDSKGITWMTQDFVN